MGLSLTLGILLFSLGLCRICKGLDQAGKCKNYKLQFERVYSVPGHTAMMNSTLVSPDVFDFRTIPYNISWYDAKTGQEMKNETGRIFVYQETLWILNVTLNDQREYVTILSTPYHCYRQATMLMVGQPVVEVCAKPEKISQTLTSGVNDRLSCPLKDYISKLDSYNIQSSVKWYKGCEPINDTDKYAYRDKTTLMVYDVNDEDSAFYTCTLNFNLGGVRGCVSETIEAVVTGEYSMAPQVIEPTDQIIKAQIGYSYNKSCRVFVPGVGIPFVEICWRVGHRFIFENDPSDRIYTTENQIVLQQDNGVLLERPLIFTELREEDFYVNYTCQAFSSRGNPVRQFTLHPPDPNLLLPIGSVFGGVMFLFIISVSVYYLFKVDIVLWFRRAFPILYTNKDLDGKLYDAYVVYPQSCDVGFSQQVETFALHTLPQVLEAACGYKLFIAGRDCLPGESIMESVEENIQASRRLLLLYTASAFTRKTHKSSTSSNNNNNLFKDSNGNVNGESKTGDSNSYTSFDDQDDVCSDMRQQFECMSAMHRALVEGTLKVVLVELEEITPDQLALFPESVRHLRKKQGALCWWKNMKTKKRWRTCVRRMEDEEKPGQNGQLSQSLSPSSRFWKKMRYHMPVRGKRSVYPEKTALLNL